MTRVELMEKIKRDGRFERERVDRWVAMADLLAVFDAIGRDGVNAVVKMDGSRESGSVYTVLVSGGRLGDSYFRKDGGCLSDLLTEAIGFYDAHGWSSS